MVTDNNIQPNLHCAKKIHYHIDNYTWSAKQISKQFKQRSHHVGRREPRY